jgi:hypothetical protein
MRGRSIRLSPAKRLVLDVLHFSRGIPTVPVHKRMCIAPLVEARAACANAPRWTAIFVKAYALLAREFPELRRVYVKLPLPHMFEYRSSVASVVVEREYQGEQSIFTQVILNPAARPIDNLMELLERGTTKPLEEIPEIARALSVAALPWPFRRMVWWLGLNLSRYRALFFGTFGFSVYSALKVESLHPLMPVTTLLNYGVIDTEGNVNVRIIYDHRVMNGATVARSLNRLEEILNTTVADEVREMAAAGLQQRAPSLALSET